MKTPIHAALAAAAVLAHPAFAASLEDAEKHAAVTLPFAEVKALIEAAKSQSGDQPPPVVCAISSAAVSLSFDAAKPTLTAAFEVDVFAKGWQLVPLIGAPFPPKSVSAQKAAVVMQDGMLCLLVKEPGHFSVSLAFDLPAQLADPDDDGIALELPPATSGRLTAAGVPARCRVTAKGDSPAAAQGALLYPANGGAITIRLVEDKPAAPVVPTAWTVAAQTLIVQAEDRLVCESRIRLNGNSGSGLSAGLELPPAAMKIDIDGADLRTPVQHTATSAELAWKTSGVLDRTVTLRYELPRPAAGEPWKIQPPRVAAAAAETSRTVLVPQPGIALSGKAADAVADSSALPAWMSSAAASGAWESNSAASFAADSRALPRVETDTARISKSQFQTRLVADGAQLTAAHIEIDHRGPLRWRFALPKGCELLSCEVNGRPANPLVQDDGQLELFVAADREGRAARSTVEFSYTARGAAFAPVEGRLALSLPATPLFIDEIDWALEIPEGYESTAFEGNVEPAGKGSQIAFQKRLVRNEAASVEIYYQKRAAN